MKDLVLVGGGHSHVAVLKQLGIEPVPGARITLISRDALTPYSGMLPGLIAGHYAFDETHIDLRPLSAFAHASFHVGEVVQVDLAQKRVLLRSGPPVAFDVLSLDIGSTPATASTPGAEAHAVPVKPIQRFVAHWEELRKRVLARSEPTAIGVVGGGAGGVELILAVQYRLRSLLTEQGRPSDHLAFHLVTEQPAILTTHGAGVAARFRRILSARDIRVHTRFRVASVGPCAVVSDAGERLALDEILWVTEAGAAPWVRESGLAVEGDGFMCVADTLESTSHPLVFGAGDIAAVSAHPRPKSGVFAVRQGPPLARNLRRALLGQPLRPFRPQKSALSLISTGDRYAVASRAGWSAEGAWLWTLKDWIDRRFMRQYSDLPDASA